MKFKSLAPMIILLAAHISHGQLLEMTRVTANKLYDVSFSDSLNGWVAGVNTLQRTTDGGGTWTTNQLSTGGADFLSIGATSHSTTWVVWQRNGYGYVGRTSTSGSSWDTLIQDYSGTISAISVHEIKALDSLRAWIIGSASFLCKCYVPAARTTNGGSSWLSVGSPVFTDISHHCGSYNSLAGCGKTLKNNYPQRCRTVRLMYYICVCKDHSHSTQKEKKPCAASTRINRHCSAMYLRKTVSRRIIHCERYGR